MSAHASERLHNLTLKLNRHSPFVHQLAIKPIATPAGNIDALYVCGLPVRLRQPELIQLFSCFDTVRQVAIHPSQRSASVVFDSSAGLQNALRCAQDGNVIEYDLCKPSESSGLKRLVQQYKAERPGKSHLQQQLDNWTANWEEEQQQKAKLKESAMAEEGWTLVTRGKGRAKSKTENGITAASGGIALPSAQAAAKRKAPASLANFYRFQKREQRRNELVELRQKFDADKRRILDLRAARKFKPT